MSFGSNQYYDHPAKKYHGRDTSEDYQVYESTMVESARPAGRRTDGGFRYPTVQQVEYNNDYEERVVEAPRVRVMEYQETTFAPPGPHHVKPRHHHVHVENVDKEAEEFIKLEHKKFELRKLMTMSSF